MSIVLPVHHYHHYHHHQLQQHHVITSPLSGDRVLHPVRSYLLIKFLLIICTPLLLQLPGSQSFTLAVHQLAGVGMIKTAQVQELFFKILKIFSICLLVYDARLKVIPSIILSIPLCMLLSFFSKCFVRRQAPEAHIRTDRIHGSFILSLGRVAGCHSRFFDVSLSNIFFVVWYNNLLSQVLRSPSVAQPTNYLLNITFFHIHLQINFQTV